MVTLVDFDVLFFSSKRLYILEIFDKINGEICSEEPACGFRFDMLGVRIEKALYAIRKR